MFGKDFKLLGNLILFLYLKAENTLGNYNPDK